MYFIFRYTNTDTVDREALKFVSEEASYSIKSYYNSVISGEITDSGFHQKYTNDKLPDKTTPSSEYKIYADDLTVGGAFEYSGFYTLFTSCIGSLGYNKKTEIITLPDYTDPNVISIPSVNTKISELV